MKPRVLVVEDDPTSRAYFGDVLERLPVTVDLAADGREAEASARADRHALWLVDAHLPDVDAVTLLPRLRGIDTGTVAVAHTASRAAALHASLRAAGYAEVLVKPVPVDVLAACVGRHARMRVREPRAPFGPAWNDATALHALGHVANVQALRALFVAELPEAVARVQAAVAAREAGDVRAVLHRLAAACALAGADALGDAVRRLHASPLEDAAMALFLREARIAAMAAPTAAGR